MATATKVGMPARCGEWGLTFDSMERPTEVVVIRYAEPGPRHADAYTVVQRLPYHSDPSVVIEDLVQRARMTRGTATKLVFQLEAKAGSPKAAAADMARRPVR